MTDANDFLMRGGVPSAKFPQIGATVSGRIVRQPEIVQQRDISTGEPKYWPDGKPMMQLVVHLATDQRDPEIPDDDGVRALYVKGQMQRAIRDAIRQAGAKGLEVGGVLTVRYVRNGQPPRPGFTAPKEYAAEYTPAATAQANTFLQADQQAPATPQAPAAPTVQQAQAAQPTGVSPEALAALQQLTPEQRAALGL